MACQSDELTLQDHKSKPDRQTYSLKDNIMKLSASFATAISLLVGDASVNAFTASQYSAAVKTIPTNGQLSRMHLSMATEAEVEVEVEVEVETIEISDYTSVNSLTYRQLQKECKKRSLAANGNTAALRDRLLKDLGLLIVDEECDVDNDEVCAALDSKIVFNNACFLCARFYA